MSLPSLFSGGVPLLFPSLTAAAANASLSYDQNLNPATLSDNNAQSITISYKIVAGGNAVNCLVRFARNGLQVTAYLIATNTASYLQIPVLNRAVINVMPTEPLPACFANTFSTGSTNLCTNLGSSVISNGSTSLQGFWNVSPLGVFAFTFTGGIPPSGTYWFGTTATLSQIAIGSWLNQTPSTTAQLGEVIAGTNIIVTASGIDSIVSTVTAPNFSAGLTIGNYSLPTVTGTSGQVLSVPSTGSTLVWEDATEVTAGDNIVVSMTGNSTTVSLVAAPTVDEITIGGYTMPTTLGTPSQVLTVPATGTTLSWEDTTAVGEVTAGANIVVTPSGNDVTVALASTIDVTGVTVNNYSLPASIGTSGQVLTVPASGSALSWETPTAGGITAITGDSNVVPTTTGSTVALHLGNTLNVGAIVTQYIQSPTVVCTNQYTLPLTIGTAGQTMQVESGTGQLQFGTTVNSITTTDPNIVLAGSASAKTVALNSDLVAGSLTCQQAGAVLGQDGPVGVGGSTVINNEGIAISNAGNNNLTIGANSIALDAPGYTTQLTSAGVFTSAFTVVNGTGTTQYVLPSTLGQPNQMLTVPPVGNQLVWDNQNPSSGISAVNSGTNITVNTVGQVATVNLSDPVTINEIKAAVVETELVRVIDDLDTEIYSLPTTLGTAGQVLTVPTSGSNLYWSTTAGSGIATITPGANITTVVNNEDVTIGVNEIVSLNEITAVQARAQTIDVINGAGTTIYQMPSTLGTSGQVLAAPSSGTTLYWTSGTGTPGISNVIGESNIYASVVNEVATVGLEPSITIDTISAGLVKAETLTVVSAADAIIYEFPATLGTEGQVLTAPTTGNQLYWSSTAGAGISSVTGIGNISAATVNEAVTVELIDDIIVTDVKTQGMHIVNSSDATIFSLPASIGTVGQVLAVQDASTTLGWNTPGVTNVTGDANVQVNTTGTTVALSLGSTINVGTVVANYVQAETIVQSGQYTLPLTIGGVGEVIAVQEGSGQLIWAPNGGGSSGISNVISTDSNIAAVPNGTEVELTLSQNLNLASVTATGDVYCANLKLDSGTTFVNLTTDQIEVADQNTNTLITPSSVSTKTLSITGNTGQVLYDLPPGLGTAGQFLTVPATGTVLEWASGAGEVSITSANANISVATTGNSVELTLGSSLDIEQATFSLETDITTVTPTGITVGTLPNQAELTTAFLSLKETGATSTLSPSGLTTPAVTVVNALNSPLYSLPLTPGTADQVLTVPSSGTQLVWANPSASGGISAVTSTNANITAQTTGSSVALTLGENLGVQSITCTPALPGGNSQLTSSTLTLTNGANNLSVSNSSIAITNSAGSVAIEPSGISAKQFTTIDNAGDVVYTLPTTLGTLGQTLTVSTGDVLIWETPSSGGGISSVSSANANLVANTVAGAVTLTPAASQNLTSTTYTSGIDTAVINGNSVTLTAGAQTSTVSASGIATPSVHVNSAYYMPTSLGTPGQLIAVPSTGTQLQWEDSLSIVSANANLSATTTAGVTTLTVAPNQSITSTTYDSLVSTTIINGSQLQIANNTGNRETLITPDGVTSPQLAVGVSGSTAYALPSAIGTPGQALVVPSSGTTLVWNTGGGSGGISEIVSANSNIEVVTLGGEATLTLNPVQTALTSAAYVGTTTNTSSVTGNQIELFTSATEKNVLTSASTTLTGNGFESVVAPAGITSTFSTSTMFAGIVGSDAAVNLSSGVGLNTAISPGIVLINESGNTCTIGALTTNIATTAGTLEIAATGFTFTSSLQDFFTINNIPQLYSRYSFNILFVDEAPIAQITCPAIIVGCGAMKACYIQWSTTPLVLATGNRNYLASNWTPMPNSSYCPDIALTDSTEIVKISSGLQTTAIDPSGNQHDTFMSGLYLNTRLNGSTYEIVFTIYINPLPGNYSPVFDMNYRYRFNYVPLQAGNNTACWERYTW